MLDQYSCAIGILLFDKQKILPLDAEEWLQRKILICADQGVQVPIVIVEPYFEVSIVH